MQSMVRGGGDGGHSVMSDSLWPRGLVAGQAPLSMGFSGQEFWGELLFPSPKNLPNPKIEPKSPALQAVSLLSELQGSSGYLYKQTHQSCSGTPLEESFDHDRFHF